MEHPNGGNVAIYHSFILDVVYTLSFINQYWFVEGCAKKIIFLQNLALNRHILQYVKIYIL